MKEDNLYTFGNTLKSLDSNLEDVVDPLSLSTCKIQLIKKETSATLAIGTAFFYIENYKTYLITNWHNLTGVNPITEKRLSPSNAGFPDQIITNLLNSSKTDKSSFKINLYEDENFEKPKWLVHSNVKHKIDVIAIPVEIPDEYYVIPINSLPFNKEYHERISDDVFILGYPFALDGELELPIWKKGSIASEPYINLEGLPKMLVDTATKSGMSGSPVIFKRSGLHNKDGKFEGGPKIGTIRNFLGVYSGRLGAENKLEAQLGIIWKAHIIQEIIREGVTDSNWFQMI